MRIVPNRFFRLTVALMLAVVIASQIPVTGIVALAQNGYDDDDDGGNDTGRNIAIAAGVAAVGYGVYYLATQNRGGGGSTPGGTTQGDPTWDVANKTADLKMFANISDTAGLKDTLREAGPFTTFAPTNTAFQAMDSRVLQDLQLPENRARLQSILRDHVVRGAYSIEQLRMEADRAGADGFKLTTITGKTLTVTNQGGLKINGVAIVESDIPATNGIVHPIGAILLP